MQLTKRQKEIAIELFGVPTEYTLSMFIRSELRDLKKLILNLIKRIRSNSF